MDRGSNGAWVIFLVLAVVVGGGIALLNSCSTDKDPTQIINQVIYPATNGSDVAIAFGGFAISLILAGIGTVLILGLAAIVILIVRLVQL